MQVKVQKHSETNSEFPVKGLIRKVEDTFPTALGIFKEEFQAEEDKAGSKIIRVVNDNKIAELAVLTYKKDLDVNSLQKKIKEFAQQLNSLKEKKAAVYVSASFSKEELVQIAKCLGLSDNSFDLHKTSGYTNSLEVKEDEEKKDSLSEVLLLVASDETKAIEHEANTLKKAIAKARELVNQPANIMTPTRLAEEARELGQACGFEVEVFGAEKIQEIGMDAFWNVAKGSDEEPKFIIMRFKNNPDSDKTLALVGKGLTYDSGGYDIKPGNSMHTMNSDMAGSAAVIGTMAALASEKAKVNVVALVAACENMLSGRSYLNGDIIGSLAGKTIEIMSTDAEGRLTLADAVTYAWKEEKVDAIVDIATLTGAVIIALGDHVTGSISDSDELYQLAEEASELCGDKIWRFPIDEDYEEKNKSDRADIKNGGIRGGGPITAGLFIRAFANKVPFLHFDIAGTSYHEAGSDRAPKGATGVGTELLYYLSKKYFA